MGAERQTIIHTNTHTFRKTVSGRAPGSKTYKLPNSSVQKDISQ